MAGGSDRDRQRKTLGRQGEDLAAAWLEQQGYTILYRNWRGAVGEIDIIAKKKKLVCFIEVKARRTRRFGAPQEAVTQAKQHKIGRAAQEFLQRNRAENRQARFDVISVDFSTGSAILQFIENAFDLTDARC